ncbi:SPOR domain-containing protein [Erythrobacter rubeus]|uniref:SPOR domain-containing protein n=1 Tax=Erythrobacter rubeus TaxID=2760803 RepID=A0ABR8KT00_9SPHN|nr:SPOR domain-containing protein [Erythrobacter rubeus]MBD2842542.1 SPOR domain-containing protein [Erythrobacter rubeus]
MSVEAEFDNRDNTEGELDLSEADSLPWLEADEEDEAAGGVDKGQIIGFTLVLVALAIGIVGTIYLLTNAASDDELIADGSIIEAPEGPIKERPEDPGGKEFAGTGNVAPAVGEGQVREGQVRNTEVADAATDDASSGTESVAVADTPTESAGQSELQGVGVQLAAYNTRSRARTGWQTLTRQTDVLDGLKYRVVEAVVDGSTVYRLQAVMPDRASAVELCRKVKEDGLDCAVKS